MKRSSAPFFKIYQELWISGVIFKRRVTHEVYDRACLSSITVFLEEGEKIIKSSANMSWMSEDMDYKVYEKIFW